MQAVARRHPAVALPQAERVALTAGRSTVLTTDFDITRIAVTNPAVADATVVQPREILIDGKAPGTISLIVWGADRSRRSTTSWSSRPSRRCSSSCRRCFRAKTSRSAPATKRSSCRAASRATRSCCAPARSRRRAPSKLEGHQHAAAAWRQREPAGHAAGAVRRSEPARAQEAWRHRCSPDRTATKTGSGARRRSSSRAAELRYRQRQRRPERQADVQRLPESVPVQHEVQRRRA